MISRPTDDPGVPGSARHDSVTRLLGDLREGRGEAFDQLVPLVYDELREMAHRQRSAWQGNETLNTTALVHEAYLKLVGQRHANWDSEAHFLAAASRAIRHILINYARDRRAGKRGGGWQRVSLGEEEIAAGAEPHAAAWESGILALDDALQRLAAVSERQARIVECRFFGGLTVEQTARALGLSTATVTRGWSMAQTWLRLDLGEPQAS